jgi:acetyl-CoA carboxylase biotin carboxyl carrier protein
MTPDEIKALLDAMSASDLAEMEFSKDGWTLRLTRDAVSPTSAPSTGETEPLLSAARARRETSSRMPAPSASPPVSAEDVRSSLSGVVCLGPSPDAPPFVTVGQEVAAGTMLCTVEAMKMFNPVTAEQAGVVEAVLVVTGDEVTAGQTLFRIV